MEDKGRNRNQDCNNENEDLSILLNRSFQMIHFDKCRKEVEN